MGQWVFKTEPITGTPTTGDSGFAFVYDEDGNLLAEYGTSGASSTGSTEYIWLPTPNGPMPVAAVINGVLFAVHTDNLNTPRRLSNTSTVAAWQWKYSAFGDEQPTIAANRFADLTLNPNPGTTTVASVTFNLRYPGQYADAESGLNYNYFRSYDSNSGRYTQADPIGLDGGWNRFGYVEGNPFSAVDINGLDAIYIHYVGYSVAITSNISLPVGHAGVIAVNPTSGATSYYEFGRYGGRYGDVRGPFNVGILKYNPDGTPNQSSMDQILKTASINYGKSSPTYAEFSKKKFQDVIDYAETRKAQAKNGARPYDFLSDNCKTFGREASGR